ncbi:MAG: fluoride efflux transporter CrcB [Bacteroidota bacterium]
MNLIAIALGGALGSLTRYGISRLLAPVSEGFPYGTFAANILSCIVIGWAYVYVSKQTDVSMALKLGIMTGFCGGFSTFSTFSLETFQLIQQGHVGTAFLYVGGSVLACLLVLWLIIRQPF